MGVKLTSRVILPLGIDSQWRRSNRFHIESPLKNEVNEFVSQFSSVQSRSQTLLGGFLTAVS